MVDYKKNSMPLMEDSKEEEYEQEERKKKEKKIRSLMRGKDENNEGS